MRGKIAYGGQMEVLCPCTEIGPRKYAGVQCLNKLGRARQDFDACRAVAFMRRAGRKMNLGFVDARGRILIGRIFAAFYAKLWKNIVSIHNRREDSALLSIPNELGINGREFMKPIRKSWDSQWLSSSYHVPNKISPMIIQLKEYHGGYFIWNIMG